MNELALLLLRVWRMRLIAGIGAEEAAMLGAAVACSATGVAFAAFMATTARRAANILGILAGVTMFLVALVHLAPEALRDGAGATISLLLGAVLGVGFEAASRLGANPGQVGRFHPATFAALIVLGAHSMIDGAVYSAAFWRAEETGLLTSLGLLIHEAPEGMVALMLAIQAGLRPRLAIVAAIAASTLTTPLGLVVAEVTENALHGVTRYLFAGSAGLLLFVGLRLVTEGWRSLRRPDAA